MLKDAIGFYLENLHHVIACMQSYLRFGSQLCIGTQPNYAALLQRTLILREFFEAETEDHVLSTSFYLLLGVLLSEYSLKQTEYFALRKNLLQELLEFLLRPLKLPQLGKSELYILAMFNIIQDNEELVEILFESERNMKKLLVLSRKGMPQPHLMDICCKLLRYCYICPKGLAYLTTHNWMKSVVRALKSAEPDEHCGELLDALFLCLESAETLVDGNEYLYNPVALLFEENKGLKYLDALVNDSETFDISTSSKMIQEQYFGANWENFLARKRGMKLKKAI